MLNKHLNRSDPLYIHTVPAGLIKSGVFLLTLSVTLLSTGCGVINRHKDWDYDNPPDLKSKLIISPGGVLCTRLESAKFMAATGWFAPDCTNTPTINPDTTVEEILSFTKNGVNMLIIRAIDGDKTYWVPLPDHDWI